MSYAPRRLDGSFQRALILENPSPILDEQLAKMGIETERIDRALEEDELVDCLRSGNHQLIYKRSRTPISRRAIEANTSLMAIMLCCIGDDSVDKQAAADHGVLVMNDPISNGRSVAEMVLGQMINLARRLHQAHRETRHNHFVKTSEDRYELYGRTLGILGLGRIGNQVAQLAKGFGMSVLFSDTREVAVEVGAAMGHTFCESISDLFRRSNVVSVHVSAEDWRGRSNRGLLDYDHFEVLGRDTDGGPRLFINASRGFLFEPGDLVRAIRGGGLQAASVDVYPSEPRHGGDQWANPYADCPQVVATPHIGAATQEAQPRIARHMALTTRLLNEYGTLRDCVFRPGRSFTSDAEAGHTVLSVVHSDVRGTKKAVDDAIFNAGASNLQSAHQDFPRYGIAYNLNILDQPLDESELDFLVEHAVDVTGDPRAIRSLRHFSVPNGSPETSG